jgi:hypothetical protein
MDGVCTREVRQEGVRRGRTAAVCDRVRAGSKWVAPQAEVQTRRGARGGRLGRGSRPPHLVQGWQLVPAAIAGPKVRGRLGRALRAGKAGQAEWGEAQRAIVCGV